MENNCCPTFFNNEDNKILNETSLENIDENEIEYFTFKNKKFVAKPCHIYDGDTFSVLFYYNNQLIKHRCRCLGYDSPELHPSMKHPNRLREKELAMEAKKRFTELLTKNKLITIDCQDFDKYGRILVYAYNNVDEMSINHIMVAEGHGRIYNGGKKYIDW